MLLTQFRRFLHTARTTEKRHRAARVLIELQCIQKVLSALAGFQARASCKAGLRARALEWQQVSIEVKLLHARYYEAAMNDAKSRSPYSSSFGMSSSESRIAFCDMGLSPAGAAAGAAVSETWKRSRIWSVPSEPRSEFCCETMDEAMLSLKRCRL